MMWTRISNFAFLTGMFFAWCLAPICSTSEAQTSIYETEPNNTPANAVRIAGAVTIVGKMEGSDQDAFIWTVSDDDALRRWTFELHGIPGQITLVEMVRVEYADNGIEITSYDKLTKMVTRDGLKPVLVENMIFEPGEYLLGIAHAGGSGGAYRPPVASISFSQSESEIKSSSNGEADSGSSIEAGGYRLWIREGDRLAASDKPRQHDTQDTAQSIRLGSEYVAFTESVSTWYALKFGAKDAAQRWDIDIQVPVGRTIKAILMNSAGETLAHASADNRGQLAFRDLAPEPGTWFMQLQRTDGSGYIEAITTTSIGQRIEGEEREPNDKWTLANRVDLSQLVSGRISNKKDTDYFRFTLDENTADQLLALNLQTTLGNKFQFCLLDSKKTRVQCRNGKGPIELPDLVLTPGEWGFSVGRGNKGMEYNVSLKGQGTIKPDVEAEPNDAIEFASGVPLNNRIKGRFTGEDSDYFRFLVAEQPQLWRFQVIGENVTEVAYYDGAGIQNQRVRPSKGQRRIRLDNVYLLPGAHFIRVSGKDGGRYTLLARPLGPPDPNGEFEPNNDPSRMQPLRMGQTRTGVLEDKDDQDYYRFFLAHWDRIRLTIQPPADGAVFPYLYWYSAPFMQRPNPTLGKEIVLEGLFPPGDYQLSLSADKTSEAEYKLSLERLERFGCPSDCEPNNNKDFANALPANHVVEGVAGDWKDLDVFALPIFSQSKELVVTPVKRREIKVAADWSDKSLVTWNNKAGVFQGTIPAGVPTFLYIKGGKNPKYRVALDFKGGPEPTPGRGKLSMELALELDSKQVAAYRRKGQLISGLLQLTNTAEEPLTIDLDAETSDHRWQVSLEKTSLTVAGGSEQTIPVEVRIPPDVWADWPVRISIRAQNAVGAQIEVFQEIDAGRETAPIRPVQGWTLPDALLGGFNVAWSSLGSRLVGTYDSAFGYGVKELFDNVAISGFGLSMRGWRKGETREVTVELAGGEPVEVVGLGLNLFNSRSATHDLRVVDFSVSLDGETFTQVLRKELLPIKTEQAFVLEQPVQARYARLNFEHNFDGKSRSPIEFGEWKVYARPGIDISQGKGFNLADLSLGGHVVWARPRISLHWDQVILTEQKEQPSVRLNAGQDLEWAVGFHHNRAALIKRLEWVHPSKKKKMKRFQQVKVAVSLDSPVGPWQPLMDWDLSTDESLSVITLDEPVWARFVKFSASGPPSRDWRAVPETLRIWEHPTDDRYRSILTEWGQASQQAIYEAMQDIAVDPPVILVGNVSRTKAAELKLDHVVSGSVSLGQQAHWYRLSVPAGQNTLTIELEGDPTVRTVVYVENQDEEEVPVRKIVNESTPQRHVFTVIVTPGEDYYVKIEEPPRNVVFSWDTSASVNAYLPTIYNSLIAYAEDIVPGRDAVNLVPFGSTALLRDWYSEPFILQTFLNDYPRSESSSEAEKTLYTASRELALRSGTKAIVVISDADTNRYDSVWEEFNRVRPRIFGIGIAGSKAANEEQDLFQDWSSVNGGYYTHLVYDGEMEIAFDRAATMLRRPAEYNLKITSSFQESPGPGSLVVVASDGASISAGAVELILDASGSMLQRLDGKRRINIAKEVLTDAVKRYIPAGTPTALRVFGHKEPNACRTDLEIPLQPLDPAIASKKIKGIEAKNLARTPIADSLAKTASDLKKAKGKKLVVLVTDGEETCDGDPEKIIRQLQDKGMEIVLNIVGFAISNLELENQFTHWAEIGGGKYFSVANQAGLSDAIIEALQTTYSVFDMSGSMVKDGMVVGESVILDSGYYRVVVASSPQMIFEKVEVLGGDEVILKIP